MALSDFEPKKDQKMAKCQDPRTINFAVGIYRPHLELCKITNNSLDYKISKDKNKKYFSFSDFYEYY